MRYFSARLLLIFFLLVSLFSYSQSVQVIHVDAKDIRKHSIAIYGILSGIGGGPQLRYTFYPVHRIKFSYDFSLLFHRTPNPGYYGDYDKNRTYRPDDHQKTGKLHELEMDFHLIDKVKSKGVNIVMARSSYQSGNTVHRKTTYTTIQGEVRRILALSGNIQYLWLSEELKGNATSGLTFYNIKTQKFEIPKFPVFSNVEYWNAFLGLKFKSINASGIKVKNYGRKFNDIHLETYGGLLLPISYRHTTDVFSDINNLPATHKVYYDRKLKAGWRIGILYRNSIKNYWSAGFEINKAPCLNQNGSRLYFKIAGGLNFNFGKIKWLK